MNDKRSGPPDRGPGPSPLRPLLFQYWGEIAGPRAPWRTFLSEISNDSFFGEKTWEKAESAMQKTVLAARRWRRRG